MINYEIWFMFPIKEHSLLFETLVWMMCIDTVIGTVLAKLFKIYESKKNREGLIKKIITIVLLLALSFISIIDPLIKTIFPATIVFFIFIEFQSIMEHAERTGVKIPINIKNILKRKIDHTPEDNNKKEKE